MLAPVPFVPPSVTRRLAIAGREFDFDGGCRPTATGGHGLVAENGRETGRDVIVQSGAESAGSHDLAGGGDLEAQLEGAALAFSVPLVAAHDASPAFSG